jgi:hypothetical protein
VPENVVEDVIYPSSTRELLGRDVDIGAFDGRDKVARELGHKPQNEGSLLNEGSERDRNVGRVRTWFLSPYTAESPNEFSSCCAWPIKVFSRAFMSGSLSRI